MKLMVGEGGDHIEISELYCGVALSTNEGEKIGICQRDGVFEISILKSKCGNPIRIMPAAPKAKELAATTANSDYAAALRVLNEWEVSLPFGDNVNSVQYREWLDKRLHSSTNVA